MGCNLSKKSNKPLEPEILEGSIRKHVYELSVPMKLIHFKSFKLLKGIPRSSEEIPRSSDHISVVELSELEKTPTVRSKSVVVFISHRWWNPDLDPKVAHPDVTGATKFNILVGALQGLEEKIKTTFRTEHHTQSNKENGFEIYVWIDYFSIDQDNISDKIKGIESLPAYIERSDIILTPYTNTIYSANTIKLKYKSPLEGLWSSDWPVKYKGLSCEGEGTEYFERAWCRLEMFIGANAPLPVSGFDYFNKFGIPRLGRPHYLCGDYGSGHLTVLPRLSNSWLEKLHPAQGQMTDPEDGKYILDIMERVQDSHGTSENQNTGYKGDIQNGMKHGYGVMLHPSGAKYEGEFKNDLLHGRGIYITSVGDRYEGSFKDGACQGHGIMTYANGAKYIGLWENGMRHGKGTYLFANGEKYVGEFSEDRMHGHGARYSPELEKIEGKWFNGTFERKGRTSDQATASDSGGSVVDGKSQSTDQGSLSDSDSNSGDRESLSDCDGKSEDDFAARDFSSLERHGSFVAPGLNIQNNM